MTQFLSTLCRQSTECHTLIQFYMFSDYSCLADNNASTMINKEIFSDGCSRMNINSGFAVCMLGHHTWNEWYLQKKQLMCKTVHCDCIQTWIRENNFFLAACCRITVQSCLQISIQILSDFWNSLEECNRSILRKFF